MTRDLNPFDLEKLRLDPAKFQRKRKNWRREFVQFPWAWVERLQSAKRISTYRLALLLVYESWKAGGRPIVLSNVISAEEGLRRRTKWNALRELERLGLVKVERRVRKSPLVVLCHLPRIGLEHDRSHGLVHDRSHDGGQT